MRIYPYVHPIVRGFERRAFIEQTHRRRPDLLARLDTHADQRCQRQGCWLTKRGALDELVAPWRPKVYLCIASRSYWNVVERLLFDPGILELCIGFKVLMFLDPAVTSEAATARDAAFSRPDKIVFFVRDPATLGSLVAYIAALRGSAATHGLAHTAPPSAYGLLPPGHDAGLYVGSDPRCIGVSWRSYRAFALTWLSINHEHVRDQHGSIAAWQEQMNLSLAHPGPARLCPPEDITGFVQQQWPEIVGRDFRGAY